MCVSELRFRNVCQSLWWEAITTAGSQALGTSHAAALFFRACKWPPPTSLAFLPPRSEELWQPLKAQAISTSDRKSVTPECCELNPFPVQGQDHVQLLRLFWVTCQVSLLLVRPKLRSSKKGVGTPHFQDVTGASSPLMLTPTRAGALLYQQVIECGLETKVTISHDKKSGGRWYQTCRRGSLLSKRTQPLSFLPLGHFWVLGTSYLTDVG